MKTIVALLLSSVISFGQATVHTVESPSQFIADWEAAEVIRQVEHNDKVYEVRYEKRSNVAFVPAVNSPQLAHYAAIVSVWRDGRMIGNKMDGTYVPDPGCFEDVPVEWVKKALTPTPTNQFAVVPTNFTYIPFQGHVFETTNFVDSAEIYIHSDEGLAGTPNAASALNSVILALDDLTTESRKRVLLAVAAFFDIDLGGKP